MHLLVVTPLGTGLEFLEIFGSNWATHLNYTVRFLLCKTTMHQDHIFEAAEVGTVFLWKTEWCSYLSIEKDEWSKKKKKRSVWFFLFFPSISWMKFAEMTEWNKRWGKFLTLKPGSFYSHLACPLLG